MNLLPKYCQCHFPPSSLGNPPTGTKHHFINSNKKKDGESFAKLVQPKDLDRTILWALGTFHSLAFRKRTRVPVGYP